MKKIILCSLIIAAMSIENAEAKKKIELVEISTSHGNMIVYLYDQTPKHKENFLKLVKDGFYNNTIFHRVISRFMIQGGDPNTKADSTMHLAGQGGPGYTIDAEIIPGLIHRKGVLAAARMSDQVNPKKSSSGSQFYIVQGSVLKDQEVQMAETRRKMIDPNFAYTEEQKTIYTTIGGTPWLDAEYTIFGEVIKGLSVVDVIGGLKTLPGDRPEQPVVMTAKIIKMSAKEIEKEYGFKVPEEPKKKK